MIIYFDIFRSRFVRRHFYACFCCLVGSDIMFSTKVFSSGNPTLILEAIQVPTQEILLSCIVRIKASGRASVFSYSAVSVQSCVLLQGVVVEDCQGHFLSWFFNGGSIISIMTSVRKVLEIYFISWHQANLFPPSTMQIPSLIVLFQ